MGKIWFTADEHYYHSNIIGKEAFGGRREGRPFKSVDQMNKTIIKNHNEVVAKEDVTYHLGDFAFIRHWKDAAHILKSLNGRHILILGNHDFIPAFDFVEMGFESVHTSMKLGIWTLIHDPAVAGVLTEHKFIHGHTHGLGLRLGANSYCVSVEMHNYYPVPLTTIMEAFLD